MNHRIAALEAELNQLTSQGQMLDALDRFYDADCVFEEPEGVARKSRQAQHDHLSGFFATLERFDGATLHTAASGDETGLSQWTFSMTGKDGGAIVWNEVLVRRWKNDRVVQERYYTA